MQHDTHDDVRDGEQPGLGAERALKDLVHEMAGLVDGALRSVQAARKGGVPELQPLETAERALEEMAQIVRSARTPNEKPGSAVIPPRSSLVPNDDAVRDAVALCRPAAEAAGIEIDADIDPSLAELPRVPLYPVVLNALRNAIDATTETQSTKPPAGNGLADLFSSVLPVIEVRAQAALGSGDLVLDVIDPGTGLQNSLGEPTEQDCFTRGFTTKAHGMGIGLALCTEIVHSVGGHVTLTNRSDGQRGAHFCLRVPASELTRRMAA